MIKTASIKDKPIQVRIFPKRLLQPETAEKVLMIESILKMNGYLA